MSDVSLDLFVIGAGSGGVRAARFAAGFGARVGIAESRYFGGTCVNVGCVPKKLLVYGAHFSEDFALASSFGWSLGKPSFDWPTLITNKNREIARLNQAYRKVLDSAGASVFEGHARFVDSQTLDVNGRRIHAEHVLIATGGWPQRPDFPGSEHAITSNEAFFLEQLPRRVLVVGGGYIAVEFASIFNGLGAQTSVLYRGDLFLRGFDQSVREHLREELSGKGVDLRFKTEIKRIDKQTDGSLKVALNDGTAVDADCVFFATGRRPMLDNLGLEHTAVKLDERGHVQVDAHFQTADPAISALGDVIGRVQLTPVALAEGMAVARRLYRPEEYRELDYKLIPTAVFSLPNIGTVGLTEEAARKEGHRLKIFETRFKPMKLTLSSHNERTLMKLVVDAESDRVLGCHMVGPDAGEMLQGLAVAMRAGATKRMFDDTIGIHPTAAEEWVTLRTPTRVDA